jgi:eukaryotic-like serine/threonine-protein kinase
MDDRWERVTAVLDVVLSSAPSEWPSLIDRACGDDQELRNTVESLLQRLDTARGYLDSPPAAAAAAALAELREHESGPYEGRIIGAHRIVRELGRGGMSRVFLAERADGAFTQQVALKLLRPGLDTEIDRERFRAERQILATLDHPNIARLLDGGVTAQGEPYLVLEYVDGRPIDQYCDEHRLSIPQRIDLFLHVIEATQYAHRNLIVHRDLKPSNILVTNDGRVKLLDFGLAKLLEPAVSSFAPPTTQLGQRMMTPEYAAAEQIVGGPITTLTDVYQLGAVLYQLLTGRLPFGQRGAAIHELEQSILHLDPPPPSAAGGSEGARHALRGDLDAIVMKALRKEPDRRYSSAAALLDDLQRYRLGEPVAAHSGSAVYRFRKFARRHRAPVAVAAGIVVLLATAGFRERTLRARAEAEAHKASAVGDYLRSVFNVVDPYAPPDEHAADITARALLDRGAARIDSTLADEPSVQSELRRLFGQVYASLGLYDRADVVLERALAQRRAQYGERHPAVADVLDALGTVKMEQGKLDQAEPLLREALAQRQSLLGKRDSATAASLNSLATLLHDRNDFAAADSLYREAVAIRRAVYGESHAAVANSLSNLGSVLVTRGNFTAAEAPYREALAIEQRVYGENHPQTASTIHNLAQLAQQQGKYAEAETLYTRALAIKRKTLGDRHPSVTVNLNNLGELIARSDNRLDEGEALLREALTLDRQIFTAPHNYIAEDLRKLAALNRRRGKFDESLAQYREALAMHRAVLGEVHTRVALDLNGIAVVLEQTGDFAESIRHSRMSLAQMRQLFGPQHLNTRSLEFNLARTLFYTSQYAEAEQSLRRLLTQFDSAKAPERPSFIATRVVLGRTLTSQGRAAEAKPMLEDALKLAQAQYGADNLRASESYLALGECLRALGETTRASELVAHARKNVEPQRHAYPVLFAQVERAARAMK